MDLNQVTGKGVRYPDRKRIARGPGSGLGKTAGRGHKGWGQRSGTSRRPGYEGGQMPIYRRVPKRGFTNARFRTDYTVINVELLDAFENGATVDLDAVLTHGLTSQVTRLFKVLGDGELQKKLTVRAQKFSKSAVQKIEAAGGTVVMIDLQGRELPPAPPPPPPKPKPAKAEKTAESEAPAKTEKPSKSEKAPKGEKQPKGEKPEKGEKPASGEKPPKGDKPEKPGKSDKPRRPDEPTS